MATKEAHSPRRWLSNAEYSPNIVEFAKFAKFAEHGEFAERSLASFDWLLIGPSIAPHVHGRGATKGDLRRRITVLYQYLILALDF